MKRCFSVMAAVVLSGSASCQRAPDSSVRDTDRTPAVKPSQAELDKMRKESEKPEAEKGTGGKGDARGIDKELRTATLGPPVFNPQAGYIEEVAVG